MNLTVQTSLWKQHRIYTLVRHNDNYEYSSFFKVCGFHHVMLLFTTHNE